MSANDRAVVHPTDFSDLSIDAFAHALRIAVAARARLYLLHVGGEDEDADSFPRVRHALAMWKFLDNDDPPGAVEQKTGVKVAKIAIAGPDPVRAVLGFLEQHPCELIVLATHGRNGVARWLHGSVAETVSRRAAAPTLFVSPQARGFVDQASGAVRLDNVLVPVDHAPAPAVSLGAIDQFAGGLSGGRAAIHLLHVGGNPPLLRHGPDWAAVKIEQRSGDVVEAILNVATERKADLIAMPTAGHHGFLDALRGSTTERVLRHAPCPVLAVPVNL